ncbi:acyltransferase domain-containing protein [Streptomyces sp. NBC_01275]|uniref:acyltransferase domain-containing protein n=1 Tax=Streptomyces sp. NBC_01275 TaxID=2903807 RepID=UPI0022590C38|nr:acyltransferase domain-containing protein [Streptomyces sp. NBC_01275]MCX4761206.1 acyltransferase domain-containing protein [Streptomyces sp. NBC_01275]
MLPEADELAEVLLDLAVPHQDIDEAVRLSRHVNDDPEALRFLENTVADLVEDLGGIRGTVPVPALPDAPEALARFYPLYVFVAALPYVRAHHRERGIPEEVGRRTLADVGRGVAAHRRWHGTGGMLSPRWRTLHFRGELYQLGRLQFQRGTVGGWTSGSIAAGGFPLGPGDPGLGLHVPDFMGPLTPEAVDRSLALARAFFARHYPEEPYAVATCGSWLLDPQLKRYLPADSNIVRFQERFQVSRLPAEPEDAVPVRFVFGTDEVPLDRLPRRTVLQRAVVDHLREGGHWYVGHGWLAL